MDWRLKFETTAERLAGGRVLLRFRKPPTFKAVGEVYRVVDAPSLVCIDISPDIPIMERYEVLLHECAHARLGHAQQVTPTTPEQEMSGAVVLPAKYWKGEHKTDPIENAARKQAETWREWAEMKAAGYIKPGDTDELKVIILLTCLEHGDL